MRHRALLILFMALVLAVLAPNSVRASHDIGPDRVYFPETGHYLSYGFLDYWRHNGGVPVFGYPISEEIHEDGRAVQYFERAVFEWHSDAPDGWQVQLRRLGAELTQGRRGDGPFRPLPAGGDDQCTFFEQTGHQVCQGFRAFWENNGGLRVFGYPISEEFSEDGVTVQYFERVRLEWHPENAGTPHEVLVGHLGTRAAERDGVDRSPVPRASEVQAYDPGLWYVPAPPSPADVRTPPAGAPADQARWIEIDLSNQYLRAWERSTVVFGEYVSTGTSQHPTPTGYFSIFSKLRYDDMTGGVAGTSDYYYLPDVPYVMYFAAGGYAIHGTYWHSNFGTPMSHGCVNMTIDGAGWVYNWAPYGTTVWIHY